MTGGSKIIQITNIAPQATKDQMQTLFGFLGKIDDIKLYPTIRDVAIPVVSRICFVRFLDSVCVSVAQHMTNTVFIDRALIIVPFNDSEIPDEQRALDLTSHGSAMLGLFHTEPKLPPNVTNQLVGVPPNQQLLTHDPRLVAEGLPAYPPLSPSLDPVILEEIRRTILIANIELSLSADDVIDFFTTAGEVKYFRFCSRDDESIRYALLEFTDQFSIVPALQLSGREFAGKNIKVYHSGQAIAKPQAKSNEAAQREIEEAMCRVKEAQNLISAAIDPNNLQNSNPLNCGADSGLGELDRLIGLLGKSSDKRSRSRSKSRRSRSRSRTPGRRRRSRSRSKHSTRHRRSRSRSSKKSRSRSREHRHRSGSRHKRRSHSGSRSRRSSRSRSKRSRSKSSSRHSRHSRKESDRKSSSKDKRKENEDERKEEKKDEEKKREKSEKRSSSDEKRHRTKHSSSPSPIKSSRRHSPSPHRSSSRSVTSRKCSPSPVQKLSKHRSRSRDRRKRSRTPKKSPRRRSKSPRKERKVDRLEKERRAKDKDERKRKEEEKLQVVRNYDEEEKGYDDKTTEPEKITIIEEPIEAMEVNTEEDKITSDDMDISNSP